MSPYNQINGTSNGPPMGVPVPAHDLSYSVGANPPPAWSQYVGPTHKAPPLVATQLVVPTELSDGPVTLTCYNCQTHITTRTKTGPSPLTWALCCCMALFMCWPCCLVPFCCPPLNVTEHRCANCGTLLGKYKGWKKRT